MAAKTVQITLAVKNITITSGILQVVNVGREYISQQAFEGQTSFTMDLDTVSSDYYYASVLIQRYTLNGISYTVTGHPIAMMVAFDLNFDGSTVVMSPESSIACIYTFARMTGFDLNEGFVYLLGSERSLKIAYGMSQNLFTTGGAVAAMIRQSPNGFETNSYPMFNSLCNMFYYCLTDAGFYGQFLALTARGEVRPNSTFLEGIKQLLHDPFTNARELYDLLKNKEEVYGDSLVSMKHVPDHEKAPRNWTLTLKTNLSGAKNFLPSGAAFVVFDADDNAWIANNFRAGAGDSGTHCPVYKYNATPADFSPVQGGGLLGVAFGAATDPSGEYITFGNFGWGPEYNNPQQGSISRFAKDGRPVSPPNGFTYGLSRVQGMEYDRNGNLWMASVGCQEPFAPAPAGVYPFTGEPSAVVVYLNQDPTQEPSKDTVLICDEFPVKQTYDGEAVPARTPYLKIFDVTPDHHGNAFVSCIGNYDKDDIRKCALSAVYKVSIEGDKLVVTASWFSDFTNKVNKQKGFESLRQVAINAEGDAVVVGVASDRATVLDRKTLGYKTEYNVHTYAPWGIKIDKRQTVFLANFGHESEPAGEETLDGKGPFGVTMLRDVSKPGNANLLTVPTGGEEVMLANGHPLYGTQKRPAAPGSRLEPVRMRCYQPIMRLTSTNIDGAGNLWCMNNWKPSAVVDAVLANPGGDGVVIFLGIAEPE